MIIFTLFFGTWQNSHRMASPIRYLLMPRFCRWTLFSESLQRSTSSMVMNANILRRYISRESRSPSQASFPAAGLRHRVCEFWYLMMVYFNIVTINIIWLRAFLLLAVVTSLGIGLWTSALNAMYRDFQYVTPFGIQIWMFASPWFIRLQSFLRYLVPVRAEPHGQGHRGLPVGRRSAADAPALVIVVCWLYLSDIDQRNGFFRRMEVSPRGVERGRRTPAISVRTGKKYGIGQKQALYILGTRSLMQASIVKRLKRVINLAKIFLGAKGHLLPRKTRDVLGVVGRNGAGKRTAQFFHDY